MKTKVIAFDLSKHELEHFVLPMCETEHTENMAEFEIAKEAYDVLVSGSAVGDEVWTYEMSPAAAAWIRENMLKAMFHPERCLALPGQIVVDSIVRRIGDVE